MKTSGKHIFLIGFLALLLFLLLFRLPFIDVFRQSRETTVVVLDVGHGGFDPGKVSVDNTLEKDINLAIALRLKAYLEAQDCIVYLTREEDRSLADEGARNKKQSDMQNRITFVEEIQPALMVSIHQNSFSSPSVHGAQVFYYHTSDNSQLLAEYIQNSLIETVDPENNRKHKSNDSYYVLKNVSCPAVIVECGFLSNPTESALLNTDIYQDEIAYAISKGVRMYLNELESRSFEGISRK